MTPEPSSPSPDSPKRPLVLLVLLCLVGLALRLWGLASGLPHEYNVAERAYMMAPWQFEWGKPLVPFWSAHSVLLLFEHKVLTLLAPLIDWLPLPSYFDLSAEPPRSTFTVIGRLNSAVLGAVTVFPVYGLGRWAWDRRTGLAAAAFVAFGFSPIREAHFGSPDVLAVFLAVTSVYFVARATESGRWLHYVAAGLLAGLALSGKLLNWPAFVVVWLFHVFGRPPRPKSGAWHWIRDNLLHPKLLAAAAAAVVGFLGTTPQVALNTKVYLAYWRAVAALGRLGGFDRYAISDDPRGLFYFNVLRWGVGELLTLLIFAGVILALVRRSRRALLVLAFPLGLYGLLLMPGRVYMSRYALPALPFLLLAAAGFLVWLVDRLPLERRWAGPVAAALVVLAILQPLRSSVLHDRVLTRTDTRTVAKGWIEANIPDGAHIVTEWHNPPITRAQFEIDVTGPYGLPDRSKRSGQDPQPRSVDEFKDAGIDYLITTSYTSDHPMLDPAEEEVKAAFYSSLDEETELVAEFSPFKGDRKPRFDWDQVYGPTIGLSLIERPGPTVKIYRLPASSDGVAATDDGGAVAEPPAGDEGNAPTASGEV